MRKALVALIAAVTIAAVAAPASADGVRRKWRGSAIGAISRNVITPYYVGYYGGHYSYYAPDPIYPIYPRECWFWGYGYPYRMC